MMAIRSDCGWAKEGKGRERGGMGCGDLMAMGSGVVECRQAGWEEVNGQARRDTAMVVDMDSLVVRFQAKSQ